MENERAQLYDLELEEAVLGSVLLQKDTFDRIIDWDEAVFYKPEHAAIAFAITVLSKSNKPVDMLTVTAQLKDTGRLADAGGAYKVATLTQRIGGTQNTEYHYRKLQEYKLLRNISEIGFDIKNSTYESAADPFELIERYTQKLESLTSKLSKFNINTIAKLSDENITRMEAIRSGLIKPGVPTGFANIDKKTGGWQKGELVVLAARPGMGKTALALQFVIQPAMQFKKPTAFFSLEMGNTPITSRVQSIISGHSAENIIRGNVTGDDIRSIQMSMSALISTPIFIDDTPGLSINQLKLRCRRLKKDKGIELIVIDYLQLMTCGPQGNREQEISFISRSLKSLAKELDIPIIALSQLSRDVEKRQGTAKRPQLSDLRESGAIEQDADAVFFIYRPEYYGIDTFDDGSPATGMAEIIIGKNRNGGLGITRLGFEGRNVRFYDPNDEKHKLQPNIDFESPNTITT